TIRPAIWRTILSSRDWPSAGSAMISRRRRMMMRSAGSEEENLGLSPPRFCIGDPLRSRSSFKTCRQAPRAALWSPAQRRRLACPGAPQGPRQATSVFAQVVQAVQRAHRQLGINGIDQYTDFDLGGGDGQNIDAALGQGLEHLRGDPGVTAH